MTLYGKGKYGTFPYGGTPLVDRVITDFQARRGIEGPQIILTWTKPSDTSQITKYRIVRKMGSFPEDETDGVIVFDSTDENIETYTDFPGFAPEFFYYKFFTEYKGSWYSTPLAEVVELAHDTSSEFHDKFFRELPEIYRTFDKARFGSRQLKLQTQDLDKYEKALLAEDGSADQGELQRFLKLFNIFFNEPLALVRAIATRDGLSVLHDVKRTAPKYLSLISAAWGWPFNWDLPVTAARKEVIELPDLYKKKGRKDVTEQMINNILSGHTATIVLLNQVIDLNQYPNGFLATGDIIGEVNFLTAANDIYVFADINNDSSIRFDKVVINIIPGTNTKLKASQVVKLENITDDFFSILDDVYIIVHETFNLTYPTDFTSAGQSFLNPYLPLPNASVLNAFGHFAVGSGWTVWDYTGVPIPSASATQLTNEKYRDLPRNVVHLDGNDDPTTTATKKVLLRCFMDLDTFSPSLYSREAGIFGNDSGSAKDSGTLLSLKYFPLRFVDTRVRYIVDFKIQFP